MLSEAGVICRKFEYQVSRPATTYRKESAIPSASSILRAATWFCSTMFHRGKSHHRHLRGKRTRYKFVNADALLDDFCAT